MNLGIFLFPKDREWRKEMKEREKNCHVKRTFFAQRFCFALNLFLVRRVREAINN